jgi:hypothetical protein
MGREQHCCALRKFGERIANCGSQEIEVGSFEMPMVDAMHREPTLGTCFGSTALVFTHAEARKMRSEHQTNGLGNTGIGEFGNTIFNEWSGVLLSEHHVPCTRHARLESGFKRGPLCLGKTGERRDGRKQQDGCGDPETG